MEKRWQPNGITPNYSVVIVLLAVSSLSTFLLIQNLVNNPDRSSFLTIFALTLFDFYVIVRIYGEMTVSKDFLILTSYGISFREIPIFGSGLMPVSKQYQFSEISQVDLVQIRSPILKHRRKALSILPKEGKHSIVGVRYEDKELMEMGVILGGVTSLSRKMQSFIGSNQEVPGQVKEMYDQAKKLWNKFKENK